MSEVVVKLEDVTLAYRRSLSFFRGKDTILRGLNFEVFSGEVLGIIGGNGAGKSSLLRLLGDIIEPESGTITRRPGLRSQLLSLQLGFNSHLSGYDNALMALVMLGKSIREAKSLLPEVVAFAEIEHLMDHQLSTFSSGEKARLGFSIAMNATPDLLLLDEILGVGDKAFKRKSSKALKQWIKTDQTAVLVSHNTNTLLDFCSRVLWMEHGEIKRLGDARTVIEEYEGEEDSEEVRELVEKREEKQRKRDIRARQKKRKRRKAHNEE